MKCYQCQNVIRPPCAVLAVVAYLDQWPRLNVYFASVEEGDPEPGRPVCDFFFPLCSPACAALWFSYVHQVMQDKLERGGQPMSPAEVLRGR